MAGGRDGAAQTVRTAGPGPFVTRRVTVRPDGVREVWESRRHRKHLRRGTARAAGWWAPEDRDWWIGVLFAVGSALFALGAVPAYAAAAGDRGDGLTYFAGSLFFTTAGFLQYREAVDALPRKPGDGARRRLLVWRPDRIDWLATAAQLLGTLEFNVSTAVAVVAALGTPLEHRHVWRPDVVGSACFLVASLLAWGEVCHGWAAWAPRSAGWWVAAVNLAGSVAFGVSAVASYVSPGTTSFLSAPLANGGTLVGALLFLAGGVLLLVERTEPAQPAPQPAPQRT